MKGHGKETVAAAWSIRTDGIGVAVGVNVGVLVGVGVRVGVLVPVGVNVAV